MNKSKPRLLTGIQASGALHIGNYFGALKPFVERQGEFESMLMVADYHALTSLKNPSELKQNTLNVVLDYLGAGLDPEQAIIFRQSEVPQHTELAWIFECLVTVPFLMQAHAYKDKVAKGLEANAGLFNYPMLMAADILLYDTDLVPVGKDQQQHIEYAREAASKFNRTFYQREEKGRSFFGDPNSYSILNANDIFKEPKGIFIEGVDVVPGTDGQKMSKSYGNTIPLFGTKDEVAKAVMGIVTDSSGERPMNVWKIHTLFKTEAELAPLYETHKGSYKALKEALIEDIETHIAPMREKREGYAKDLPRVHAILKEGNDKARAEAESKMKVIRERIGITL